MRLAAALLFLRLFPGLAGAQDFQQWNEVDVTASWPRVNFLVPFVARTDAHLANPQLAATGIIASFPLSKHLTLTGGYLFADLPQIPDQAHVPLVALLTSLKLKRFTLGDQNRFEKLVGYKDSPVRYRNWILADRPIGETGNWHFFCNDEVFFNLTDGNWNQNRFKAGGGARLSRRLFLDLYYLQRNSPGGAASAHVLGTDLTVKLR
jgi:hypothetical protein